MGFNRPHTMCTVSCSSVGRSVSSWDGCDQCASVGCVDNGAKYVNGVPITMLCHCFLHGGDGIHDIFEQSSDVCHSGRFLTCAIIDCDRQFHKMAVR